VWRVAKCQRRFLPVVPSYERRHCRRALASLRKAGLKFDIMTTSFFLGRQTIKPAANSEMPIWQDRLFITLAREAANATDFFSIPSDLSSNSVLRLRSEALF
jgi:K+ transporter